MRAPEMGQARNPVDGYTENFINIAAGVASLRLRKPLPNSSVSWFRRRSRMRLKQDPEGGNSAFQFTLRGFAPRSARDFFVLSSRNEMRDGEFP